jgi:hypothetical protein
MLIDHGLGSAAVREQVAAAARGGEGRVAYRGYA